MDFSLPEEVTMLQTVTRRFVQEELIPLEKDMPEDGDIPEAWRQRLQDKARAIGLWALDVPREYGGAGVGLVGLAAVREEYSKTVVPSTRRPIIGGSPSALLYAGNDAQKERWFYPVIRGEKDSSFAQTEPNAGSDPASMETSAVRHGDQWLLNGRKIFISGAQTADFFTVLAVTDRQKRSHGGITCFIVERDTPGFEIVRDIPLLIQERPCELAFVDCAVPDANRLGEIGEGFALGQKQLGKGRLMHGPGAIGKADRCLEMAIKHAKQRVTFGRPIAERQAIQWMLADSALELHAGRLMIYQCAWLADNGQDIRIDAAKVKVFCDESAGRTIDCCVQIHGTYGLSKDLPLQRFYREVRHARLGEGSMEIMRFIISRVILRD